MNNDLFHVKPVQHYDGAHYPSSYARDPSDRGLDKEVHPLTILVALVLVLGLSIGVAGCYLTSDHTPDTPLPDGGSGDGGPDSDPPTPDGDPPIPDCVDGDRRCTEDLNFQLCAEAEWSTTICVDYCRDVYGPDAYVVGCDAEADEPCRCEYDILAGEPDPCYPNDLFCADEWTIVLCSEDWREVNCNTYCQEQHDGSSEWYSNGCDQNNAENPCQCEYGMIDGFMPECEPGDVVCIDESTVDICVDGWEHRVVGCDEYCVELYGEGAFSESCNDESDDPCECIAASSGS